MAKNRRVSLLFKGYDFDKTDITIVGVISSGPAMDYRALSAGNG